MGTLLRDGEAARAPIVRSGDQRGQKGNWGWGGGDARPGWVSAKCNSEMEGVSAPLGACQAALVF